MSLMAVTNILFGLHLRDTDIHDANDKVIYCSYSNVHYRKTEMKFIVIGKMHFEDINHKPMLLLGQNGKLNLLLFFSSSN